MKATSCSDDATKAWLDQHYVHELIRKGVFAKQFSAYAIDHEAVLQYYVDVRDAVVICAFYNMRENMFPELRRRIFDYACKEQPIDIDRRSWFLDVTQGSSCYRSVNFLVPDRNWRISRGISWKNPSDICLLAQIFHGLKNSYIGYDVEHIQDVVSRNYEIYLQRNGLYYVWLNHPTLEQALMAAQTANNPVLDHSLLFPLYPELQGLIASELIDPFAWLRQKTFGHTVDIMPLDL